MGSGLVASSGISPASARNASTTPMPHTRLTTGSGACDPGGVLTASVAMRIIASQLRCASVRGRCMRGVGLAVAGDGVVPVGEELGVAVSLVDLGELGEVECAAPAVDAADPSWNVTREPSAVVVGFGVAVRAVGVGELLPSVQTDHELLVRQHARVLQQQIHLVDELVAASRVRRRSPERVGLGDTDRPGGEMLDHRW